MNDTINPFDEESITTNRGWTPQTATGDPAPTQFLDDFQSFACFSGLYTGIGDADVVFRRCVLADHDEHIRLAGYHTVAESLLLAETGKASNTEVLEKGYVIYDLSLIHISEPTRP